MVPTTPHQAEGDHSTEEEDHSSTTDHTEVLLLRSTSAREEGSSTRTTGDSSTRRPTPITMVLRRAGRRCSIYSRPLTRTTLTTRKRSLPGCSSSTPPRRRARTRITAGTSTRITSTEVLVAPDRR